MGVPRQRVVTSELDNAGFVTYPASDSNVTFMQESFRKMTPYAMIKLQKLGAVVADSATNPLFLGTSIQLVVVVVDGWSDTAAAGESLTGEGRELGLVTALRGTTVTTTMLVTSPGGPVYWANPYVRRLANLAWTFAGFNWMRNIIPPSATSARLQVGLPTCCLFQEPYCD